jgi:hypothetical protein
VVEQQTHDLVVHAVVDGVEVVELRAHALMMRGSRCGRIRSSTGGARIGAQIVGGSTTDVVLADEGPLGSASWAARSRRPAAQPSPIRYQPINRRESHTVTVTSISFSWTPTNPRGA